MNTANAIEQRLSSLANKKVADHSAGFFKTGKGEYGEGDKFLGVRVLPLRAIAKKHRDLSLVDVKALLGSEYHEVRLCAAFILVYQFTKSDTARQAEIYAFYLANTPCFNGWDIVDSSAHQILGGHLFDKKRDMLYKLAASPSLWERRMAIIATLYFIREHDFDDTLAIAERFLEDKEDLIHKATGWMLREVGKRDRAIADSFLTKHCQKMPRVMLRYAIEKLPADQRKRYLDGTA